MGAPCTMDYSTYIAMVVMMFISLLTVGLSIISSQYSILCIPLIILAFTFLLVGVTVDFQEFTDSDKDSDTEDDTGISEKAIERFNKDNPYLRNRNRERASSI